jgi:repressor LexA
VRIGAGAFNPIVRIAHSRQSLPEAMMPKPLTELESRVLDYLIEYLRRNTYQPSIREIGREFSIRSTKTVSELLQSLAEKGWIERDPARSRGVRLLGLEPPVHAVTVPLLSEDEVATDGFVLDRRLAGRQGVFLFIARSPHLTAYGIRAGDLLVIEPTAPADVVDGDLLLVRRDDGAEVSKCSRRGADFVLDAERAARPPLVLTQRQADTALLGVVAGVVRRLRPPSGHVEAEYSRITG